MSAQIPSKQIRIVCISSFTYFLDKFPVFSAIIKKNKKPLDDWVFFMTVAGVGIYLYSLKNKLEMDKTLAEASKQLIEIDRNIPLALRDFFKFMEEPNSLDTEPAPKIGLWVLWNMIGEIPAPEETKVVGPAIGKFLCSLVGDLKNNAGIIK